mmetsp:Transcript_79825/g.205343  ORF Transcript_79825/g.205343 Transcript_79825/m.205343 type:complete len:281 (+) Transcript_79825:150-992(+)
MSSEETGTSDQAIVRHNLRQKHAQQLRKTEMCKYFLANKCGNGKRCPFAHRLSEIRQKPNLFCTSMCPSFLRTGNCENPACSFAHSEGELRATAGFFKTKMCRFAGHGRCKHGENCRFAHSPVDLQTPTPAGTALGTYSAGTMQAQVPYPNYPEAQNQYGPAADSVDARNVTWAVPQDGSVQGRLGDFVANSGLLRHPADAPSDNSTWSENPSTSDQSMRGQGQDSASDQFPVLRPGSRRRRRRAVVTPDRRRTPGRRAGTRAAGVTTTKGTTVLRAPPS